MRNIIRVGSIILGVSLLVGCGNLSSKEVAEYNRMLEESEQVGASVDTNKIEEAILFLLDANIIYTDYIEENKDKLDLLSDELALKVKEGATERDSNDTYSKVSNPDEELVGGVNNIGENDYPIYGSHYEVVGYGTKEESEESVKEFKSLRDNTILEISTIKDIVTAKVDNKYYGEYLIRIRVKDDKITDFIKLKR